MKLPKWPILMVQGKRISPEQADKVIIRTSNLWSMDCNDSKWNKTVDQVFGVERTSPRPLRHAGRDIRRPKRVEMSEWERKAEELGVLPLNYLGVDRIASTYADGPSGWVDWDGTVGQKGRPMADKWPGLDELTGEWRVIAHAFPFLELEAQIAEEHWVYGDKSEDCYISHRTPLARWTVGNGAAELHAEPGDLMFAPPSQDEQNAAYENFRIRSERGVSERRLRAAVQRCTR